MTKLPDQPHPDLKDRLRTHVNVLAEIIGERNTGHPSALEATRAYLRRELQSYGATVDEQTQATDDDFSDIGRKR